MTTPDPPSAPASTPSAAPRDRRRLTIPAALIPRFCFLSRQHASLAFATAAQLESAAEILQALLQRGVTSVPFGIVLDWTVLVQAEWDFPFRSLDRPASGASAEEADIPLRPMPADYENDALTPYLLSPTLRRLRDAIATKGRTPARIVHLLERLFEGCDAHVATPISHYRIDARRLTSALQDQARRARDEGDSGEDAPADGIADDPGTGSRADRLPGIVAAQHESLARFLRHRLLAESRGTTILRNNPAESADGSQSAEGSRPIEPLRPTDVDVYELEHVEIFASRAARLHCRRFGDIAQALGPPDTRRLSRASDTPEVVVNSEDDTLYPTGGVAELTTSGSFESLLPSELMYLEDKGADRDEVDLFSLKYVENELLYFVRDAGLLVRRRRLIHLVVWDQLGFRFKHPRHAAPMDQYLAGMLLRLARDLFAFFEGEGVRLQIHWVGTGSGAGDPSGAPGGRAGESDAELFDLLFRAEVENRLAGFHSHASPAALAEWIEAEDHPTALWFALAPPDSAESPATPPSARLSEWVAAATENHLRPGGRPITVIRWHTDPLPSDLPTLPRVGPASITDAAGMTAIDTYALERRAAASTPSAGAGGSAATTLGTDRMIDLRFHYPADRPDPLPHLRGLRQILLQLMVGGR